MNEALAKYISDARTKGHSNEKIQHDLVAGGWSEAMVKAGLKGEDPLEVPPPPPAPAITAAAPIVSASDPVAGTDTAVKVVSMKTTAGIEYLIMFISMWVAAMSLGAVLHSLVDQAFGQDSVYTTVVSFSTAALVVSLPIFAWLFLYLKRKELAHPEIRRDQNRKAAVQLTLIITFIIGIIKLVMYVYQLLNTGNADAGGGGSVVGNFLHTLITLGIAGGIFFYYWRDEHRKA
jgi:hypothetical protein